jgi:transcription initiation factor TFIID TATA-box-binding protein
VNEIFIKSLYILQEGKASIIMVDITIENIVASTQIADELDVKRLADAIPDAKYHPESFPGMVLHFEDPKTATLLFSSGKVICTGAKKMGDIDTTMQKLVGKIQKVGISVIKTPEMKTQNIVASADLKKELQLSAIARGLLVQNVEYEPEQFPGLVYRMDDLGAVVLLFSSGKIVCTGAKTVENVSNVIERMKEKLSSLGVL